MQLELFSDVAEAAPTPTDPNVVESDVKRLTGQNLLILQRLEQGPATNAELAGLSLKYTSRISDLRKYLAPHGRDIVCERGEGGTNTYRIVDLGT